jgi:uncharacterized membrane protein YdfJ with MMPL/SSD domain
LATSGLAFGSAVAALLPIVTAVVVVAGGLAGLDLLKSVVNISRRRADARRDARARPRFSGTTVHSCSTSALT